MSGATYLHTALMGGPDVVWPFHGDGRPTWRPVVDGKTFYGGSATLDPFPGYPHDENVVRHSLLRAAAIFPPTWDVHLWVADREEVGRTNGYSQLEHPYNYDLKEKEPPVGVIFLSGKRTPIHPALTRYLVAHEYGHHVEWMCEGEDGMQPQAGELIKDYASLRGLSGVHSGAGGTWHSSAHEVFACDFRILVLKQELEFWPHAGVQRPEDCEPIVDWWAERLRGR